MSQSFPSFHAFRQRYPIRPGDPAMLLGSGSYGRVVKVEDQLETEWVAIKISEFNGNDLKSLKAEVELAQRVPRQANIARYEACHRLETDTGISDFAIMKYYPDGNLADLLRQNQLITTQVADLTRGILLGLQHLHRHRIVHRDFKPANILISRDNAGRFIPKIADFGLSKLISHDELDSSEFDLSDGRGTPSYKAPEQIEGNRVSFNLDLWAFGVILYEMLTGSKPFQADQQDYSEQAIRRTIEQKIVSVDLPDSLNQISEPYQSIIRRCLVHSIHERARKADELLDLLDDIPALLVSARKQTEQGDYVQALRTYELILTRRDDLSEAIDGFAFCTRQLSQPKLPGDSAPPAAEATDLYLDSTDVYVASVETATDKPTNSQPGPVAPPITPTPTTVKPAFTPIRTRRTTGIGAFPWRVIAPVAVGLGVVVYLALPSTTSTKPAEPRPTSAVTQAGPATIAPETNDPSIIPLPNSTAAAETKQASSSLNRRVDVAFLKAQKAYAQKNYADAIMLTNSALLLIPSREDVQALREKALEAGGMAVKSVAQQQATPALLASPEAVTTNAELTESETKKEKQALQANYDQLIESGLKSISGGNNKVKAISTFTEAGTLARQHELSTTKAEAAYAIYLAKANKIFDSEEYEGALNWYKVAQSLKDTPEVRTKIKQCTNNL